MDFTGSAPLNIRCKGDSKFFIFNSNDKTSLSGIEKLSVFSRRTYTLSTEHSDMCLNSLS